MSDNSPRPSGSKSLQTTEERKLQSLSDDGNVELYIHNDKAEIERLESEKFAKTTNEKDDKTDNSQEDDRIAKIKFQCCLCDMEEMVHYFGLEPGFAYGIEFTEPTYVIRDPFQPPPPRWKAKPEYFVALGAHCTECNQVVCKDTECSFFYVNTYCLRCAKKMAKIFPLDVQQKLKKQLSSI